MRAAGTAAAAATAAALALLCVGGAPAGAAAQTCARRDRPYPHPQLGTGRPLRTLPSATDADGAVDDYPVVYEGVTGDGGWDGKPGVAELVLLSRSLASWKYRRNLHNGALYTSPAGYQGVFPLGMSHPPLFQFRYAVSADVGTPPSDCNATGGGGGGAGGGAATGPPSFEYVPDAAPCCGCRNLTSPAVDVYAMTGQRIYARSAGAGNWATAALTGFVNGTTGAVALAGPVYSGGSMAAHARGRIFQMRRVRVPALTVRAPSAATRLAVHVLVRDAIVYAVELNGVLISDWSALRLRYKRSRAGRVVSLGDDPVLEGVRRAEHRGTAPLPGPRPVAAVDDSHNEAVLSFQGGYDVTVRVFDDGFALRFGLRLGRGKVFIVDEEVSFVFAKPRVRMYGTKGMADYALFGDPFYADGEEPTIPRVLDDISPFGPEYNLINNPQLFADEAGTYFLTAMDVLPVDYPRAFYMRTPTAAVGFRTVFDRVHTRTPDTMFWGRQAGGRRDYTATAKEDYIAHTAATRSLPWRAFGVTTSAVEQAELLLVLKLAPPPDRAVDYSFAPAHLRTMWDWGNFFLYRDPATGNVTAETLPTTRLYKAQADFAAAQGVGYITIDEGWNFPTREHFEAVKDTLDPAVVAQFNITGSWQAASGNNIPFQSPFAPNFDMVDVIQHAKSRGVGVLVWSVRFALIPGYYLDEAQVEAGFKKLREWGAAGLKIDSGAANDQKAVAGYHFVAAKCAEYQLVCYWHGPSQHGEARTYPHFLSTENANTGESRKFGFGLAEPVQHMALPLLRGVTNPLDYQPGLVTNLPRSARTEARVTPLFNTWEDPLAPGTRTHELALTVLYWTGVSTLFDAYFRYADLAASADAGDRAFVRVLTTHPGVWDETRWLAAALPAELDYFTDDVHRPWAAAAMPPARSAINEAAIVARRAGRTWWFAGVTGWAGYTGTLDDFGFLRKGATYACTVLADAQVVDGKPASAYTQAEYQRIHVSRRRLQRGGNVPVVMAPAGGWMMECTEQ